MEIKHLFWFMEVADIKTFEALKNFKSMIKKQEANNGD